MKRVQLSASSVSKILAGKKSGKGPKSKKTTDASELFEKISKGLDEAQESIESIRKRHAANRLKTQESRKLVKEIFERYKSNMEDVLDYLGEGEKEDPPPKKPSHLKLVKGEVARIIAGKGSSRKRGVNRAEGNKATTTSIPVLEKKLADLREQHKVAAPIERRGIREKIAKLRSKLDKLQNQE